VGVLSGLRVLELSHFLAGPYAGMVLADLGADVIKVEDPHHLDEARAMNPRDERGESYYFMSLNWGKRSVALDLMSPDGKSAIYSLVRSADVVLDNYRPGVMSKLELDHEHLTEVNPRIVTCSLTGFGETGPYSRWPGYDYTIQALAGVMDMAGEPDGPPTKAGISYVDHSGGITAALAICAALCDVNRTGEGRHIDLGLIDVQVSMLTYLAAWNLNTGYVPSRQSNSAHPSLVPAQNFRTSDGWISIFVGNDAMWQRLVKVLRLESLSVDGLSTREGRHRYSKDVTEQVQERLLSDTSVAWASRLASNGVACAAVNSLAEALTDAHVEARNLIGEISTTVGCFKHVTGPVPTLSAGVLPPPLAGEHTREVLREVGLDADAITRGDSPSEAGR
jgi:crotonobetainyl-CoA:carnitine CoA-transferase CaiB-like acyl-CoA transferase